MPTLTTRLDKLSTEPPHAVASLLRAALAHAEPSEQYPIALALLGTGQPAAAAAVIRLLDRHTSLYDELLAMDRHVLASAIRLINRNAHPASMMQAVTLIDRAGDAELAGELLEPLRSYRDGLRAAAGATVLRTTVSLVGVTGRRVPHPDVARHLDLLLAQAMRDHPDHRRFDVLIAAALVHRHAGPELNSVLRQVGTPQRLAVQGVARRFNHALVRANLINWLDSELLGRQVTRALYSIGKPAHLAEVLEAAHLLLVPARRRMMRHTDRAVRCLPPLADAVQLSDAAQQRLPRYVAALPLVTTRRATYLADLIALRHPTGRWRAAELLLGYRTHDSDQAVRRFVRDVEPIVASVAAAHRLLLQCREREMDHDEMRVLRKCTHSVQAQRAAVQHAGRSTEALAQCATTLSRPSLIAAARQLLAQQPQALLAQLDALLRSDSRQHCLAAVFIVRRLRLATKLRDALVQLLAEDDAQRTSAAVSALAVAPAAPTIEILREALHHRHDRVRANAIDGLSQTVQELEPDRRASFIVEVVAPHTLSSHNRERANALRAWIRHGRVRAGSTLRTSPTTAADRLRDMLRDSNPMHRVSAVWVAGRTRGDDFLDDLRAVITDDPQPAIRRRATAALSRLVPTA